MAIRPNPDGTVSIVDDASGQLITDGVPPDMLGSLYTPGAVNDPRQALPDLRVAGPGGGGAGGTSGYEPPQAMGAEGQPNATPVPPTPAPAPPPPVPTGPLSGGPGSEAAPAATGQPSPVALRTVQSPAVSSYLMAGARGSPGRLVKAHDQLVSFQKQVAPKLTEETKLEQERGGVSQQRAAAEGGALRQAAHEDAGLNYERQRVAAEQEVAGIRDQERQRDQLVGSRMRELDMMGEELRSKRKGASNPDAYWEDKGEFAHAMATIGNALYIAGAAVAGFDPMGLAKQIDQKIDRYNQAKRLEVELLGAEIEDKRTQLGEVRKQFLSRDAAESATRALMNDAMAAETASMAEHYKSADAQATATQLIANLQAQAADARAAAELAEKDAVTQTWKHVPTQAVGGSAGGIDGIMARAKKLGITNIADALVAARTGYLPVSPNELEQAKFDVEQGKAGRTSDSLDVPGVGQARSEMDAKEMREELSNYIAAKNNFARARVLGAKAASGVGAYGRGTDEYHEADALTQMLVTQVAKSYGGVITDADREAATKEVPNLTSYGGGWETRLEAAEKKLENNFRSRVAAKIRGGMPAPITSRDQ